jgi:hypothetical protein
MKNRIWLLLLLAHCLGAASFAQNPAKRQQVLQVSNGAFVAFKSETSTTDNNRAIESQSPASLLYSQALSADNHIVHRVLTDADRRVIFGYDLSIESDPITKKFSIGVLPADEAFRRSFLKESNQPANEVFATFPRSTTQQTLDDGDAVSLELLINPQSGVKIVDVVRVTFDRSILREGSIDSIPKDFSLDAVMLSVKGYQLVMDGRQVAKSKATVGCRGSLLWLYIPERGRFIFSLVPREGYAFEKIGVLEGDKIRFVVDGEQYEWLSTVPILPSGGTWNLWVLQDRNYTPLFSSDKPIVTPPSILDKIGKVVGGGGGPDNSFKIGAAAPVKISAPQKSQKSELGIPPRVMIGGADRMENLLPRNP